MIRLHKSPAALPLPCFVCGPVGGRWIAEIVKGEFGERRCACARGRALHALDEARAGRQPAPVAKPKAGGAAGEGQMELGL